MNKFERMVSSLPNLYKPEVNTMIGGLLKAWALSDDNLQVQISNTKDQLFIDNAESRYLDYLGNNAGVPRDPNLGMTDDDFRKLIPILSYHPKQVRRTVIALLDVFWGETFTRPNITSTNVGPFNFGPATVLTGSLTFTKGSNLVKGVGTIFSTELSPGDYIKPSTLSGKFYYKVSAVLSNTELELSLIWDGEYAGNILATKGVIKELQYSADNNVSKTIYFKPNAFEDLTAVTVEELANFINNNIEHSTFIAASEFVDPVSGTKLNIRTKTSGLSGAIQILGGNANLLLNFATNKIIDTRVNVYEINPNEIVVKIPSSVPILRRSLKGAEHPKSNKAEIFSNTATFDFSSLGASSTLTLTIDGNPFTVTFVHANFQNIAKVTNAEIRDAINTQSTGIEAFIGWIGNYNKVGLRTTNGSLEYQVTGGTANTILGFTTALQQDDDLIQANLPSSYVFNPNGQLFTVTGVTTTLSATVLEGAIQSTLNVSNAANFPNLPGKIMIDFGRKEQEGPIKYNSRPNNSTLLIDASHIFQNEHLVGRTINLVQDSPTVPRVTGEDYPVYIVGTEQARQAAQSLVKKLLAAGVVIRFIIDFPDYLFECTCRDCGAPTDPDYKGSLTNQGPLTF